MVTYFEHFYMIPQWLIPYFVLHTLVGTESDFEMTAIEAACPTPGTSLPSRGARGLGSWGKTPRVKGEGVAMNIPQSKIWSSIGSLTIFCTFPQSLNQECLVISARNTTLESGKVFASAGGSGVNKMY